MGLLDNPVLGWQGLLGGSSQQAPAPPQMQAPGALYNAPPQAQPVAPPAPAPQPRMSFADWIKNNPAQVSALAAGFLSGPGSRGALANASANLGGALQADQRRIALNNFLKAKSAGQAIDPQTAALLQSDPTLADTYLSNLMKPKQREIRMDQNGVPRYTDTQDEVFPGVKSDTGPVGIFSGKSVMGQGLNYLISQGKITEQQAAEMAASKPVVGADGTIYLATPSGIFGNGQPVTPAPDDGSDGSGDNGAAPQAVAPPAAPGTAVPGAAPPGMIPLTGPKTYGSDDNTKAAGFAKRMIGADKILGTPESAEAGTSYAQKVRSNLPFGLDNYAVSDNYQKLDQAERDFVNAVLRRESGAAISQSEFDNARKQYFPQPGDTADTLEQKATNRKAAIDSVTRSAGPLNQDFINQGTPGSPASGAFEWHPETGLKPIQ